MVRHSMLNVKVLREIKSNFKQYLSVILIATLAVTLFTGIWANYKNFDDQLNHLYEQSNMCDGIVMTKSYDEDLNKYLNSLNVTYEKRIYMPAKSVNHNVYAVVFDENHTLNKPSSMSISTLTTDSVLVEENFLEKNNYKVGDVFPVEISFLGSDISVYLKISGTMTHPESLENTAYNPSFIYIAKKAFVDAIVSSYNSSIVTNSDVEMILSTTYNQYLLKSDDIDSVLSSVKTYYQNNENYIFALNRSNLPSNITIEADVTQAKQLLYIFPVIFYLVAVLIILTSISQLINREQKNIGILKALGFSKYEILFHFTKIFLVLGFIGSLFGIILGPLIIPNVMGMKYNLLYQLPKMSFSLFRVEYLLSVVILVVIILFTCLFACYDAMNKVPASSLRGENAVKLRLSRLSQIKFFNHISLSIRMAFRNMKRKISRSLMVVLGVLGCSSLLVCGFGIEDTINYGLDLELKELIPYDVTVNYEHNRSLMDDLLQIDNVVSVDEYSKSSVNLEKENLISSYIYILPSKCEIFTPSYNANSCIVSKKVSEQLNCSVGDNIYFSYNNEKFQVTVSSIVDFCISQGIFISMEQFSTIPYKPSGAWIKTTDASYNNDVSNQISKIQGVLSSITMEDMTIQAEEKISSIKVMTWTIKIFAILLAIVVLYNLALLNFKERTKDIATLKVLGFSKLEVAASFMIEIITLTFVGALIGLAFGYPLLVAVLSINETPIISYIYHINPLSYVWTIIITCGSSIILNLLFSLLINKVQMVESLKSVE